MTHSVIVLDVNVLVYAFDEAAARHERYAGWLATALARSETVALSDTVLSGFLRVVTNQRIYSEPTSAASAMQFVDAVIDAPSTEWVANTRATWRTFSDLIAQDDGIRGNHVPDAYLASLTISHGAKLATADRGFARYPGLTWFDPADAR